MQNALLFVTSVAAAFALASLLWMLWVVVPHFVPVDRSYAFVPVEPLSDEPGYAIRLLVSSVIMATAAAFLVRQRSRGIQSVIATPIALIAIASVGATLNALGSADIEQTLLCLAVMSPVCFSLVVISDRGHTRTIATIGAGIAVLNVALSATTFFDVFGPDAAARARDRAKLVGIRYAGSHYARYPNTPWTEKPKSTTDAEMTPLHLEYTPLDRNHYRLCTAFETSVATDTRFPHGVGRTCYTMTFDDSY